MKSTRWRTLRPFFNPIPLQSSECCGYGAAGAGTNFDCVQIPGALDQVQTSKLGAFTQFCGRSVGLVAASSAVTTGASKTICSEF